MRRDQLLGTWATPVSLNRYSYAVNPVVRSDPSGLATSRALAPIQTTAVPNTATLVGASPLSDPGGGALASPEPAPTTASEQGPVIPEPTPTPTQTGHDAGLIALAIVHGVEVTGAGLLSIRLGYALLTAGVGAVAGETLAVVAVPVVLFAGGVALLGGAGLIAYAAYEVYERVSG